MAKRVVVMAAIPLENRRPSSAPSSAASFRSATRWVGFPYRPYSSRSTRPSKWSAISWLSRNAYVAVCTIGDVSALASFCRGSPPWTDWVLGPGSRRRSTPLARAGEGAGGGGGSRRCREFAKSGLHEPHLVRVSPNDVVHEAGDRADLHRPVGIRRRQPRYHPQMVRRLLLGELQAVRGGDHDDALVRSDDLAL